MEAIEFCFDQNFHKNLEGYISSRVGSIYHKVIDSIRDGKPIFSDDQPPGQVDSIVKFEFVLRFGGRTYVVIGIFNKNTSIAQFINPSEP